MTRWLLSCALMLAAPAAAQLAPPPPAVPAPSVLAFTPFEDRMTVPVTLAAAGPFRFIVDTGAQRTVISRELAATLGYASGPTIRVLAMSGAVSANTVLIPSLSVSVLGAERIQAPALAATDMGAPGILGLDTLQRHAVTIDFDQQAMSIAPATKRRLFETHDPDEVVVRARSRFGQLVVTDAFVGDTRVRVVIDTGSAVSVGNDALRRLVNGSRGTPISVTSVTGRELLANYTTVPAITIGEIGIHDLPIAFADAAPFRSFGLANKPAIMLGMDALKMFRRVYIDFPNREVRLLLPVGYRRRLRDSGSRLSDWG